MLLTVLAAAMVLLAAGVALQRGHHVFAIAVTVMGAYELLGPVLYYLVDRGDAFAFFSVFSSSVTEEGLRSYVPLLAVFFGLFVLVYAVAGNRRRETVPPPTGIAASTAAPRIIPAVILAFGVVSVVTGAGEARLEDYVGVGDVPETSRFFSYGGSLVVACTGLLVAVLARRHYMAATLIALCMMPLLAELFLAGRRQWFAPSVLLILLVLLYSRVRFKAALATALAGAAAVVFALQYALREELQQGVTSFQDESTVYAVLAPQAGEFVAIGAISLGAWERYVLGAEASSDGLHLGYHLLNTLPFLRLGDLLFPRFASELKSEHEMLAPWGGFSLIADAVMAFGWLGVPMLAVLLAVLSRIAHRFVRRALTGGMSSSAGGLYALSITATLLVKYRGGLGDAIQSFVSFSILFWFFVLIGYLFLHRRTDPVRAVSYREG